MPIIWILSVLFYMLTRWRYFMSWKISWRGLIYMIDSTCVDIYVDHDFKINFSFCYI